MNVMVDHNRHHLAILDWGSAQWGDLAAELANVPFHAGPLMLKGYREVRLFPKTTPWKRISSGATWATPSTICDGRPSRSGRGRKGR